MRAVILGLAALLGALVGVFVSRLVDRYLGVAAASDARRRGAHGRDIRRAGRVGWDWALPAYLYLGAISVAPP